MGRQSFQQPLGAGWSPAVHGWLTAGLRVQPWVTGLLTHELQPGLLLPSPLPYQSLFHTLLLGVLGLPGSWGARELSRQQLPAQGEQLVGQEAAEGTGQLPGHETQSETQPRRPSELQ